MNVTISGVGKNYVDEKTMAKIEVFVRNHE